MDGVNLYSDFIGKRTSPLQGFFVLSLNTFTQAVFSFYFLFPTKALRQLDKIKTFGLKFTPDILWYNINN